VRAWLGTDLAHEYLFASGWNGVAGFLVVYRRVFVNCKSEKRSQEREYGWGASI
jgi:hypothetical protein